MSILYILLVTAGLFMNSCAPKSGVINSPEPQLLTCKVYPVTAQPKLFEASFFPGAEARQDTMKLHFTRYYLGYLPIPSGRIVATDPVSMRQEPFTRVFPKGRFPIELAVAHFGEDERVAFARIIFSQNPVARWEMALLPGQEPLPVGGENFYGYSVDAGVALFIDADHIQRFNQYLNLDESNFGKIFIDGFHLERQPSLPGLLYSAQNDTLATFSTGWGDGSYATYIGLDAQNQPCRLLTDFQVVDWQ